MAYQGSVGGMTTKAVVALKERFQRRVLQFVRPDLIASSWTGAEDRPRGAFMEVVPADVIRIEQRTHDTVETNDLGISSGSGAREPPGHRS